MSATLRVLWLGWLVVVVGLAAVPSPAPVRAEGEPAAVSSGADDEPTARRRARAMVSDDDDGDDGAGGLGLGSLFASRSGLFGTGMLAPLSISFSCAAAAGARKRRLGVVLPVLDRRAGAARGGVVASRVPDRDPGRAGGAPLAARSVSCPSSTGRAFVRSRST